VASDGTVLRGLPVQGSLPTIEAEGGIEGERLADQDAIRAARVAGAAPTVLQRRIDEVRERGSRGLVATLKDGPELIFGDATRLRAKWVAAARVLSSRAAEGASYIDLRLPGRPAAGGLPAETVEPVAPAGVVPPTTGAETATPGATDAATTPAATEQQTPATTGQQTPGTTGQQAPATTGQQGPATTGPATPQSTPQTAPQTQATPPATTQTGAGGGATAQPQP
jgi:hypothetical protein